MVPFGAALIAAWIDSPSLTTTILVGAGPATERMAPALLLRAFARESAAVAGPRRGRTDHDVLLGAAAEERAGAERQRRREQSQDDAFFFIFYSPRLGWRQAGRDPRRRLRQEGLVGQGAQKIHDPIDLGVRELRIRDMPVQIEVHALGHRVASSLVVELDGAAQVGECAGVRVGCGARDVAKRGHLEPALELRAAQGGLGADVERPAGGLRHADDRDLLVGEQRRRVALGTARDERAEHVQALDLTLGERGVVAVDVAVVAAVERDQRGLESGERREDLLFRDRAGIVREGFLEQATVGCVAVQAREQLRRRVAHLFGRVERAGGLRFERVRARVPEEPLQECHIPQRGRRTARIRTVDADRARASVGQAAGRVMATRAGQGAVTRQHRIEE